MTAMRTHHDANDATAKKMVVRNYTARRMRQNLSVRRIGVDLQYTHSPTKIVTTTLIRTASKECGRGANKIYPGTEKHIVKMHIRKIIPPISTAAVYRIRIACAYIQHGQVADCTQRRAR